MNLETAVKPLGAVKLDSVVSQAVDINARLPQIDPHCEAIAVIPVYREFYGGGRIVELLEELQAQNIGPRGFETILVVNNPPAWDAQGSIGLVNNLRFLKYLDEQKQVGNFLNVHVIDCTDGEIPKRHMGLVRGLGQLVAENRLDQTQKGEEGIIFS